MPMGMQSRVNEVKFCADPMCLNEFGLIYVSLYILGNYARYFPDRWMSDVEKATPLSLAALEMIEITKSRAPVLIASELSRAWILDDA